MDQTGLITLLMAFSLPSVGFHINNILFQRVKTVLLFQLFNVYLNLFVCKTRGCVLELLPIKNNLLKEC